MISEWEKQILAYCIRVSRGTINKGMLKMSIFPEDQAIALGGITVIQFIDIVSYVKRLHENLKDPIRRRGFDCNIQIGHKVDDLMSGAGYQIGSLDTEFPIETHQSYGNEVQFHFKYAPSIAPAMVFEDLEVVELNHDTHIESLLNAQDTHLELEMQQKFMSEFDFIDDDVQKEINNISQKHKKSAF